MAPMPRPLGAYSEPDGQLAHVPSFGVKGTHLTVMWSSRKEPPGHAILNNIQCMLVPILLLKNIPSLLVPISYQYQYFYTIILDPAAVVAVACLPYKVKRQRLTVGDLCLATTVTVVEPCGKQPHSPLEKRHFM